MLTIKPEYQGEIMERLNDDFYIMFDTNTADPSEYEYYYNNGFDFAFDKND